MTMQQRPPRVQSVLRGPSEASCLQQALTDGQRAAQNGYTPIAQSWGRDAAGVTLTVLYELTSPVPAPQPAAAPWTQPTSTASAWTPPQAQSQPQPTSVWNAPQPQAAQPAAWTQPAAATGWGAPQQPMQPAQPQYQQPMQRPPLSTATQSPTVNRRVAGAIASIVVFVIAFLVYSALNRALY